MSDEELQQNIEAGRNQDSSLEAEAYRKVFSALQREVDFTLSPSFINRVIQKIETQKNKEASRERWWFFGGLFIFLIGFVVALTQIDFTSVDFKPGVGVYTFITGYKGLIVFGVLFILALNYIDKKFIKPASM
jgi:hypothetical protein